LKLIVGTVNDPLTARPGLKEFGGKG